LGERVEILAPLGLPPVPIPADNPPTAETIALGRRLFYAAVLPVEGASSCASCHDPEYGFSDGRPRPVGLTGAHHTPSLVNVAYHANLFWDGRASSLEQVHTTSLDDPAHGLAGVGETLSLDPTYVGQFEIVFGPGPITVERMAKALASFERTILSGNSPFDRYFYGGDESALSESAKLGVAVFRDAKKGNCGACHSIGEQNSLFSDNKFHNSGVAVGPDGELVHLGRYEVTKQDADRGAFKTPSLRNVARTAPYMHDGSLQGLKEAMDFYVGAGNSNPWRDEELHALDFLTGPERAGIMALLEALTGELPENVGPPETTVDMSQAATRGR
jgi:cytochrome c peroxidase